MQKTVYIPAVAAALILLPLSCNQSGSGDSTPEEEDCNDTESIAQTSNAEIDFAEPDTTCIPEMDIYAENESIIEPAGQKNSLSMVSKIWDNLGSLKRQSDSLSELIGLRDSIGVQQTASPSPGPSDESDSERRTRHQRTVQRAMSHLQGKQEAGGPGAACPEEPEQDTPDLLHEYTDRTRVMCMFSRNNKITGGETLGIVLLEPATINGKTYRDGSTITAKASIDGGRVSIRSIDPPGLEAYGLDMQKGLSFSEDSKGRQILSEIGSSIIGTLSGGISILPGVKIPKTSRPESVTVPEGFLFYMVYSGGDPL